MAKEIERKFLVADDRWRAAARDPVAIRQFYLADMPSRAIRVRLRDNSTATLTLKFGGHTRIRDEFEYPLPLADAKALEEFAEGRIIEKTRHLVSHRNRTFEVDVFAGRLSGLVIAELETPDDVAASDLPDWLGPEVTDDPAYYNAALAFARELPAISAGSPA